VYFLNRFKTLIRANYSLFTILARISLHFSLKGSGLPRAYMIILVSWTLFANAQQQSLHLYYFEHIIENGN